MCEDFYAFFEKKKKLFSTKMSKTNEKMKNFMEQTFFEFNIFLSQEKQKMFTLRYFRSWKLAKV